MTLLPALPVFDGAAAKQEGLTVTHEDGIVRFDFVDITAKDQPERLVRGFGIFATVTDSRLITATNTGQFDFRIVFEDGATTQSFVINAGSTLAFTVPTVEFSSYIGIAEYPPPTVGNRLSGTVTIWS